MYTVLEYKDVELTTSEGKTKKATTGLVEDYVNKFGKSGESVSEYHYLYDSWGNITAIYGASVEDDGSVPANYYSGTTVAPDGSGGQLLERYEIPETARAFTYHYTYNDFGEVIQARESYESSRPVRYSYTYDAGGNILTETINDTVHTYTYDEVWKDKLIAYDGKEITYDVFGCPLNYMGSTMEWDIYGGLTSVDNGTDTIAYTYMGDGQRRTKTVNGDTTTYHYNNGMLLSETTGDETLRYYYDSTGKVASLIHETADRKETGYFYTRNAQGDITGIYRSSDSKLMGSYEYDLWGRPVSIKPTEDDTADITHKNPYRYRNYYYDEETGFYYLNARYYDPQIRRFISADSMNALMLATTDVGCKNLFCYAENNPVTNKDGSGNFVDTIFDVISLAGSIADVCKKPNDPMAWACLAGDAADVLIPGVAGIGEVIRGAKTVAIAAGAAEAAVGVAKGATKLADKIDTVVDASKSLGKKVAKSSKETELFLPDEFYKKNLPKQVSPSTKSLPKSDEFGNLKQTKYYDNYGREKGWVDYTNHGYPQNHTEPHWHEVQWNAQYPHGHVIDHRLDSNPPF